ncbi:MAG: tyrosine-type recombinase/integrase [Longimicrobiales bacterium]
MTTPNLLKSVEEYLAFRRGLGFSLEHQRWLLLEFARYADRVGHQGPITVDLATRWALSRSDEPAQAERRLSAIRSFARHRALFDPATEVPPIGVLGRVSRRRKPPHIYTHAEITALLHEASLLLPRGGLRPRTYVTLLSLLASTGLRLSEACHLTHGDVDLTAGVLTVRESKFRKSRLVPLHATTTQALTCYAKHRRAYRDAPKAGSFFRTDRAPALTRWAVFRTFGRLRMRLGWTAHGRACRPRIHDLRHTFAVRRLVSWYEAGVDVDQKILALATYLGHAMPSYTYWYVSAVPELMALTSQRFEHFAGPKVESAP